MAPHPTHRLNAWLVPADPDRQCPGKSQEALDQFIREHQPMKSKRWGGAFLTGGWVVARLDLPPSAHLYGNKQGGYQVRCSGCEAAMVQEAIGGLRRWQEGGPRRLQCPNCGMEQDLAGLQFRPPAAPGRFAIELRDVQGLGLTSHGKDVFTKLLGGDFRVIGSRG